MYLLKDILKLDFYNFYLEWNEIFFYKGIYVSWFYIKVYNELIENLLMEINLLLLIVRRIFLICFDFLSIELWYKNYG